MSVLKFLSEAVTLIALMVTLYAWTLLGHAVGL